MYRIPNPLAIRGMIAALLFMSMAAVATAQPPVPLPTDPKELVLSDDLTELKTRVVDINPKLVVHNKVSFTVFVPGRKLGKNWHALAETATAAELKDDAKFKGATKYVEEVVGVSFSCYKKGTNFTHVIFHVKDTKGGDQAVGLPLDITADVTNAVVENFHLRTNAETIRETVKALTGK